MVQEAKLYIRKVVLTVNEKLEILKSVNDGTSYTVIAEKFGIAMSTVANIKKDAPQVGSVQEEDDKNGFQESNGQNDAGQ